MKRVVTMVVIFALIVGVAVAEEINLSDMSLDELIQLKNQVIAEIDARIDTNTNAIYEGYYVVGEDIKEGDYVLTIDWLTKEGSLTGPFICISKKNSKGSYKEVQTTYVKVVGQKIYVKLEEGQRMELYHLNATIEMMEKASWMP